MECLEYNVPLVYRNPNSHLVQCLPYLEECTSQEKATVETLIEQEKANFEKPNYLEDLPEPNLENKGSTGGPLTGLEAYKVSQSISDWNTLEKSKVCLGHYQIKALNLEILNKHGLESLNCNLEGIDLVEKRLEHLVAQLEQNKKQLNSKRKQAQLEFNQEEKHLKQLWKNKLKQVHSLRNQVCKLRSTLNKLKTK